MTDSGQRLSLRSKLVLVAIVIVACELVAYAGLWLLPRVTSSRATRRAAIFAHQSAQLTEYLADSTRRDRVHPELGWIVRPGFKREGEVINAQGLRNLHEYAPQPAPGVLRVAAFGDSFVYGSDVDTKDSWPTQTEQLYPQLEMLNYGTGGYGDDQAYIRYRREGADFSPTVVVLGFTPDDLRRLTNRYRKFIDDREFPWSKPRFVLEPSGDLRMIPPPMPDSAAQARVARDPRIVLSWGEHEQWFYPVIYRNPLYDYSATVRFMSFLGVRIYEKSFDKNRLFAGGQFNASAEAFALQVAITKRFTDDVRRAGQRPFFIMLPDFPSVMRARDERVVMYQNLVDTLRTRGVEIIDPLPALVAESKVVADPAELFTAGGHYAPRANTAVARFIGRQILDRTSTQAAMR
jgi:hypothetical protein